MRGSLIIDTRGIWSPMNELIIRVLNMRSVCRAYQVGDEIIINEGYELNLEETDRVCMHSLALIIPYYVALPEGVELKLLGPAEEGNEACLQYSDLVNSPGAAQ